MNRAKRGIIMAAGIGQRMRPVTLDTPKPMVKVNGVRMIDTVIDALNANGISDIYVVTGYKKECFEALTEKYPDIALIENPYYDSCNNISSLYAARELIPESVILDGDQMIYNPDIVSAEFERSCYCCRWTDEQTDEWLLQTEDNIVTSCSRTGGKGGWQLYSVSFWSKEDGERLREHLAQEFERKRNRNIFWDDVALFCHAEEYKLGVRPIRQGDIVEIDSLEELAAIDKTYGQLIG